MRRIVRRPSAGMVVGLTALFVALGGTGYAAVVLPAHSVGTKQLKRNAVISSRVRDFSLLRRDFKRGQLPRGPRGPRGPAGPQGATGPPGATGPAGASALTSVPSGQTIRGAIGGDFHAFDSTASDFGADATFPIPAPTGVSDNDVFVNVSSWQNAGGQTQPTTTDTSTGCNGTPGNPTAPPGKVCIYVSGADHAFNLAGLSVLFGTEASRYGFKLKWDASATGDTFVDATWAYTAP
jgi:hypothetical protein